MIVAIIGPDGSGKTTQAVMLADRLKAQGVEAVLVRPVLWLQKKIIGREMTISKASPRLIRVDAQSQVNALSAFYRRITMPLMGLIYTILSITLIKLFVGRRRVVVCDRYFYQFFYDLFGQKGFEISRLFPKPDLAFLLSSDLEIIGARQIESDRGLSGEYFIAVQDFLGGIAGRDGIVEINASDDIKTVNDHIFQRVLEKIGLRGNCEQL